ncbi:RidA family protein [Reichenbachiella sp. MALMAid0571]|uniref:RidA family protein n=1 Tax=Reichenbachiella sp. MALMAid0571 TaxID=3143939 RepID=UPI0032DE5A01
MENKTSRRSSFKKIGLSLAAIFGVGTANAISKESTTKEVVGEIVQDNNMPLFSGAVKHGNTLYIAGKGYHKEGDIKVHTKEVLDELERELKKNGSSMEKVLKVNVYLNDLNDYKDMNEVYRGRFGMNPPVRTTVATYGGVPGDSLVEIDCIAALD